VNNQTISTYFCSPSLDVVGVQLTGYAVLGRNPNHNDIVELDIHALEECLFVLDRAIKTHDPINIVITIHFETVANRKSREALKELLVLVPDAYKRLLTINLAHIPNGIPESRLGGITADLLGAAGKIAAIIDFEHVSNLDADKALARRYLRSGISIITINVRNQAQGLMMERAKAIAQEVHVVANVQLAALEVANKEQLSELMKMGYCYLSSDYIGRLCEKPLPPYEFTIDQVS
jgi:hypothetical protein